MRITVPISVGEFIDNLTILEIKSERITDPEKRRNVAHELEVLTRLWHASGYAEAAVVEERARLKALNGQLWEVEDHLRDKERARAFDHEFIELHAVQRLMATDSGAGVLTRGHDLTRVKLSGRMELRRNADYICRCHSSSAGW